MKYIYTTLLVASLFGGFSSCDYLEIEPVGQVIPHKLTEYRALLTEGYSRFPANDSKAYTGVLSDEVKTLTNYLTTDYSTGLSKNLIWQYTNDMFEYPYRLFYGAIFQANAVISGVKDAEDNADEPAEQILGEAYALRAYTYFCLVNLYGKPYIAATASTDKGIPIASVIDIDQKFIPAPVADVYKFILSDIENAEKLMTVEIQEDVRLNYRFSRNALQAFKARVCLYMGRWQDAYDEATAIIPKYTLVDLNNFTKYPWVSGSTEAILALEHPFSGGNGDLISAAVISDEIYALFSANDVRTTYFVFDNRYGYKIKNRYSSDRISIHASEMYLIAAEAATHLDNMLDKAKEYLNTLQAMRFKTNSIEDQKAKVDAMDKDALIREIAEERARELISEGHRWFDLRRTTRTAITKTYDGTVYTLEKDDPRYTLPFPKDAVESNPNLNE